LSIIRNVFAYNNEAENENSHDSKKGEGKMIYYMVMDGKKKLSYHTIKMKAQASS
jgi:hypothetical protein